MTSARALPTEQNDRIRARVKAIVDELGTQTAAAKALKVGRHLVTQHLLGNGAGHVPIEALRAYTGETYEELVEGSAAPPERTVERPDDYPNRAKALAAWRLLERDEEAAEHVESIAMDRDDDPSPDEWFADLEREERRLAAKRKTKAVEPPAVSDWDDAPRLSPRKSK